jgi:hypothetical protein
VVVEGIQLHRLQEIQEDLVVEEDQETLDQEEQEHQDKEILEVMLGVQELVKKEEGAAVVPEVLERPVEVVQDLIKLLMVVLVFNFLRHSKIQHRHQVQLEVV